MLVPSHIEIPTCGRCWSEFIDGKVAASIEPELAATYLSELQSRVRTALDKICPQYISQRKLELRLGLSQGYLSRLRAKHGNPSPALVAQLAQLACDPFWRLGELERFWAEPTTTRSPLGGLEP